MWELSDKLSGTRDVRQVEFKPFLLNRAFSGVGNQQLTNLCPFHSHDFLSVRAQRERLFHPRHCAPAVGRGILFLRSRAIFPKLRINNSPIYARLPLA
jgi:hypothetical protein